MTTAVNWGDPRLPERFWDKVSPCPMSGCWHWTGSLSKGSPVFGVALGSSKKRGARAQAHAALCGGKSRIWPGACGPNCINPLHQKTASDDLRLLRKRERQLLSRSQWKIRNPEAVYFEQIWRLYGVTRERFVQLMNLQGDACGVCRVRFGDWMTSLRNRPVGTRKRPNEFKIDHCHQTDVVRGILCHSCNVGLGLLGDDPVTLRAAAEYVDGHQNRATDGA